MTDDDGDIGAEVSSRLDEMFGDEDSSEPQQAADSRKQAATGENKAKGREKSALGDEYAGDSPIKDLKALVYGIEWEITDDIMVSYLKEVKRLEEQYQNDKILSMFLKLHESIGKYIKARKAQAHPDALEFVTSVFLNFEKVLLTPNMSETQKKRLLSGEVKKFKNFKQRVVNHEGAGASAEVGIAETEEPIPSPASDGKEKPAVPAVSREDLDYIVEELKKTIKAEFHTIRQILENLGA